MKNQIILLKHLEKIEAKVREKNINDFLKKISLVDESDIHDFLSDLEEEGYIKWTDGRPIIPWEDANLIGFSRDVRAPKDYQAKITIEGMKFLRDDNFKYYNKTISIVATIVAFLAIVVSVYFGISSSEKEQQVKTLKQNITSLTVRSKAYRDSTARLKAALDKAGQASAVECSKLKLQIPKDSIEATETTNTKD